MAYGCMKHITAVVCMLAMAMIFSGCNVSGDKCNVSGDKVIASIGRYESREFFTSGGFQDYTDYAKYHFGDVDVAGKAYLKKIQESDLSAIDEHLEDFEGWIEIIRGTDESNEVVVNYDFDRSIIDLDDYIYIDSEEVTWSDGQTSLVRYNIYFFDTQTQVLYYFHNNI